jgi:transposase
LFAFRRGQDKPELFLYDVTSSYLEDDHNERADWGYNRDKKRGKKQIVIGLLCDEAGEPVSVEVFAGNTNDPATVGAQMKEVAERFGCRRVTFRPGRKFRKKRAVWG